MSQVQKAPPAVIEPADLQPLLTALTGRGYRPIGPTIRDHAIVYAELTSAADLPAGWTEVQVPGSYRLAPREDRALFGYTVGPHSWKRLLFPPAERLFTVRREEGRLRFVPQAQEPPPLALIGVRPCDLRAISVQDRVFTGGEHQAPDYRARRERLFIVAVQCAVAANTCFCTSMGTGPRAEGGFDLALTEVIDREPGGQSGGRHYLLVEAGTPLGAEVLAGLPHRPATQADRDAAAAVSARTAAAVSAGRTMDTTGICDLLFNNPEHPRWDDVASRCLSCGNCTMACPTCFCSTVEDSSDLGGGEAERWRRWDSCFTLDFSYIHGGSVRPSIRGRYRHWMTHKLATWFDQFGSSGCVGCGRCLTWCPVGIDITEEVRAIRGS